MRRPRSTPHTPPRHAPSRRRWRWLSVPAAAAALVVPACGRGQSDAAAQEGSAGSGGTATSEEAQAYADCLSEHGVDVGGAPGDPAEGAGQAPEPPDADTMQSAQEACAELMPEGGAPFGGPGAPGGARGEEMQAYLECLGDNGVELPQAPEGDAGQVPSNGDAGQGPPEAGGQPPATSDGGAAPLGLDSSDPAVAAAMEACADLAPTAGSPPTAPGSAPTDPGATEAEAARGA